MCKIVQVCFCWNMLFMSKAKLVSSSGKQISFSYSGAGTKHRLAPNSKPLPMSLYSIIISPYSSLYYLHSWIIVNGRVFHRMHRNFQKTLNFLLSFVSANLLEGDRFLEFFLQGGVAPINPWLAQSPLIFIQPLVKFRALLPMEHPA